MALSNCKECGKEVSNTAKACPHCGVKKPVPRSEKETFIGLAILAAIFLVGYVACSESSGEKTARLKKDRQKTELMDAVGVPYYARGSASCAGSCCAYNERTGIQGERRRVMLCKDGSRTEGKTCKGFECW